MNRPIRGVVALLLVVVIAGCGGAEPEPETVRPATPPAGEARAADAGPDAATELVGIDWVLDRLSGADATNGVTITLGFADGKARGNAGCNGYGRPYAATEDGGIDFDVLAMTVEECVEPPGVMALEGTYLAALDAAGQYRTGEGRLELFDAAGEMLLEFVAAPAE
ncbi:MAG: META domain-containing protein [Chloroflexota bacterium]|nr:META domain-containing protein [Chloroflexota bacterium]MDP6757503.1 META domain-containing protein [Chloroflexota bacterium]